MKTPLCCLFSLFCCLSIRMVLHKKQQNPEPLQQGQREPLKTSWLVPLWSPTSLDPNPNWHLINTLSKGFTLMLSVILSICLGLRSTSVNKLITSTQWSWLIVGPARRLSQYYFMFSRHLLLLIWTYCTRFSIIKKKREAVYCISCNLTHY